MRLILATDVALGLGTSCACVCSSVLVSAAAGAVSVGFVEVMRVGFPVAGEMMCIR